MLRLYWLATLVIGWLLVLTPVAVGSQSASDEDEPPFGAVTTTQSLKTGLPSYISAQSAYEGTRGQKVKVSATLYTKKRINGKLEAVPLPGREIVFLVRWYKKSYPGNKYDVRYTGNTDIQGVATFNIHVPRKAARGDRKLRIEFAGDALPVNEETYQGRYRISKIRVVAP